MKNSHLIAGADFISGQQGRLGTSAWSSNSWGHGEYCNFTFGKSIKNSRFTNTQEMRLFCGSFSNNVYLLKLRVTPIFCRLWPRYGAVPSLRPVPSIARTLMKCSLRSSARWISSIAQKTEKFRVSVVSSHSISVKEKRMLNDYHRLHQVSEKCRRSSENFPSFSPTPHSVLKIMESVCPCRNDTFVVVFKLLWTTSLGQSCI